MKSIIISEVGDNNMTPNLVPIEEWDEYKEMSRYMHGDREYLKATHQFTEQLNDIVTRSTSFNQLKTQIEKLVADRRELVKYALEK